jgi:homoserine O-acetyltransferase
VPDPHPATYDAEERFPLDLPASGAWMPGDPAGDRRFITVTDGRPFALEGGGRLDEVVLAYESWGELAPDGSNAVLVCHALTGDSHAAGSSGPGHPAAGWWEDLIGPGRAIDTDRWFVVCSNVLGGCQGSTGPASTDPATGRPYGSNFPQVTARDMVRAQALLADRLGVDRWVAVIGGSMGGMQVLEWGAMFPRRVGSLIPLATVGAASAMQIGYSAVERLAIVTDPQFAGGDYYDAAPGQGPWHGLAVARQIAQITYRTSESFDDRFGRDLHDPLREFHPWGRFEIESYLDHHGQKLVRRFDANTYLILSKSMDLHDIGRGRGGVEAALGRLTMPVFIASISSDALYPPYQQREIHEGISAAGGDSRYHVVESNQGHDGFLLEHEVLGPLIAEAIDRAETTP